MKPFKITSMLLITVFLILFTFKLFSGSIEEDETIIFPSTYGWFTDEGLNIAVHGWVFEMEKDSIVRNTLIELFKEYFEETDDSGNRYFDERIRYFLTDNERGKEITVNILNKKITLPKTEPNGHTISILKIRDAADTVNPGSHSFTTTPDPAGNKIFTGTFQIISKTGYSVISDIDDTIKDSNVLNKEELIQNTFFRKFKAVRGMPKLYKKFENEGVAFHYVSGSPWQLYPFIYNFLNEEQFPQGSVDLKFFRIKDKSFINFIIADQLSYKINSIKTILDRFPERKFILIGDSGEKDPEVYSELAGKYKGRIKYIFIRDVGLIDADSERRRNVIKKSGSAKFVIFKEAAELEKIVLD